MTTETCQMKFKPRGVILQYKNDSKMSWLRVLCELIDNSLDAGAKTIKISRFDTTVKVRDDGTGNPVPDTFVNVGASHKHSDNGSGYYGIGGTAAGIRASQATRVEYRTTSGDMTHVVIADWAMMVETDVPDYEKKGHAAKPQEHGTEITISNCRKFGDTDKLFNELGFLYSAWLADGVDIAFKVDGRLRHLKPYKDPLYDDFIEFSFECCGCDVHGTCGVLAAGESNPYKGWVVHWGPHRVVKTIQEPAGDKSVSRLHGHIYLPKDWPNITLTKDAFSDPPEELYELIAQHCQALIDRANELGEYYELRSFNELVEIGVNTSLSLGRKGRRPDTDGKSGTVEPTDSGATHENFKIDQPAEKPKQHDQSPSSQSSIPTKVKLEWSDDLDRPWAIYVPQSRRGLTTITLDRRNANFAGFIDRHDSEGLRVMILLLLSHHLASASQTDQLVFNFAEEDDATDIFAKFSEEFAKESVASIR